MRRMTYSNIAKVMSVSVADVEGGGAARAPAAIAGTVSLLTATHPELFLCISKHLARDGLV